MIVEQSPSGPVSYPCCLRDVSFNEAIIAEGYTEDITLMGLKVPYPVNPPLKQDEHRYRISFETQTKMDL